MALRASIFVGKSSLFIGQSKLSQTLSSAVLKGSNRRPIMTSLTRMEKALEHLKTNPYFEKYAKNIAKLQETSPEEFLSRVEQQETKLKNKKTNREAERNFNREQNAKPSAESISEQKGSSLDEIMKVDMIRDKNKDEIVEIWLKYHRTKDCISGAMDAEQFDKMFERGEKYSTFLLPLPRENGYEFIVTQFHGTKIHMTPLIWYQSHKENAPECLTMIHYLDLKESKGVVLMKGEFDSKSLNAQEAQCLANELQLYYSTDNESRVNLLKRFSDQPNEFRHMDLIAQLETISLGGSGSVPDSLKKTKC